MKATGDAGNDAGSTSVFVPADRRLLTVGLLVAVLGPLAVTPLVDGGALSSRPGIPYLLVIVLATALGRAVAAAVAIPLSTVLLERFANLAPASSTAMDVWAFILFVLVAAIIVLVLARRDAALNTGRIESGRLRLLGVAGDALTGSLDIEETLQRLGDVIVPQLADWFSVDLVEEGAIRNVVVMHPDPSKLELARELQRRFPTDPDAPSGAPHVIRTGEAELTETIPDEMLRALIDDPDLLLAMRRLGLRCAMVVPLTTRGKTIGAITLIGAETHERYGPGDLQLAEEIADRAALAIDTARLFAAETAARAAALEEAHRNEILKDVTAAFGRASTTDEVIAAMLHEGIRVAGARAGTVAIVEEGRVTLRGVSGYEPDDHPYWHEFHLEDHLPMSEAIVEGRPVVVSTTAERDRRYPLLAGRGDQRDHALACVPLLLGAEVLGAFSASYPPDTDFGEADLSLLRSIGEQCAQAIDRARARDRAARARARLDAVAAASQALARSLDLDETVATVIDLATEHLGAAVSLWRLDREAPELVAESGETATGPERMRTMAAHLVSDRLRTRPFEILPEGSLARDPTLILPLAIAGSVSGALTVGQPSLDTGDEEDLAFAAEVARRMARALENARLYRERDHVARVLQEGLLPTALPEVPGIELAVLFVPEGHGRVIGGDFYDVFQTADGRWAAVVGDVCGKGVEAATLTGMARHTLRALAESERPSRALEALNHALLREPLEDRFCTVALLLIEPTEPRGARVTICSGGHPLPQRLSHDGEIQQVGEHGTLLGITPDVHLCDVDVRLDGGDALIVFTDGIVGKHEASPEEPKALLQGLGGRRWSSAAEIRDHVARFVDTLGGERYDDIAVLVMRAR